MEILCVIMHSPIYEHAPFLIGLAKRATEPFKSFSKASADTCTLSVVGQSKEKLSR